MASWRAGRSFRLHDRLKLVPQSSERISTPDAGASSPPMITASSSATHPRLPGEGKEIMSSYRLLLSMTSLAGHGARALKISEFLISEVITAPLSSSNQGDAGCLGRKAFIFSSGIKRFGRGSSFRKVQMSEASGCKRSSHDAFVDGVDQDKSESALPSTAMLRSSKQ